MSITFKFLEAGQGDAILISVDGKNILVDGGDSYENLCYPLEQLKENKQLLDLVVLTHQDNDHINGLIDLLGDKETRKLVQRIWFNSFEYDKNFYFDSNTETSTGNAIKFLEFVRQFKKENGLFTYNDCVHTEKHSTIDIFEDAKITLLSPTRKKLQDLYEKYAFEKELYSRSQSDNTSRTIANDEKTLEEFSREKCKKDNSVSNGSSIAFILTYKNRYNFLLLGDAHIDVIVNSLIKMSYSKENKLTTQLVKLSHHGSKNNISQGFLELIDADTFVISTNGGHHNHPDAITLSKIILNPERNINKKLNFIFNYEDICRKFSKISAFESINREKYNFSLTYLSDDGLEFE